MKKIILILLTPLFITSSHVYDKNDREQKSSTIVIFRRSDFQNFGCKIKVNETMEIKNLKANTYIILPVHAGTVIIETSGNFFIEKKRMSLQIEEDQLVLLEVVVDYGFLSSAFYLVKRDEKFIPEIKHVLKEIN